MEMKEANGTVGIELDFMFHRFILPIDEDPANAGRADMERSRMNSRFPEHGLDQGQKILSEVDKVALRGGSSVAIPVFSEEAHRF